jgi:hypothetical protein
VQAVHYPLRIDYLQVNKREWAKGGSPEHARFHGQCEGSRKEHTTASGTCSAFTCIAVKVLHVQRSGHAQNVLGMCFV